jgi:SRSO17 transposase
VLTDEDLAAWVAGLDDLFALVAGRFGRVEPRRRARAYVRGLLAPLAVKNGWTLAEAAGDATPDGMQRLLNAAAWDADGVRDDVRGYVAGHLGSADGVLVVDETGFLKKGARSAGVQRQYSGTAGRVENCQLGVFLAYATGRGRALIDRELYLPKSWTDDRDRCRDAAVPDDVQFATKPELARLMLGRALDAGVPAAWVTADEAYGRDGKFRAWLERRRVSYVVAGDSRQAITGDAGTSRAGVLAVHAPDQAWKRRSCGNGSKGPRVFDWAAAALPQDGKGEFQVGDKFETFYELQQRYGVTGAGTIQAALEPLRLAHVLRSGQGRGTFVQSIPSHCRKPPTRTMQRAAEAILSEVAAGLAQLSAQVEAARALLNPEEA